MNPICFQLLGRPIYWYGVLVASGFLLAVANWSFLGRREGRPRGFASEMGFWIMFSGIIGARLAYVAANLDYYAGSPLEVLRFDKGGLIYYGGFIGGCLGLVLFARTRREPVWRMGDYAITGIPLAHALGRFGCYLNGCCFGRPTEMALGVSFPPGSGASLEQAHGGLLAHSELHSLSVHPTQLYETAFNLLVYAVLLWWYPRRTKNGQVVALYLLTYPVGRFFIEFLRGDERLTWVGLNVAQEISLGLFVLGVLLFLVLPRPPGKADA